MVARFALLQVVTLALMAQAAPVVRSPGDAGPSSPSARGLLQGDYMEATPRGFQDRVDLGAAAGASKVPFKPMALGLVGGVALDHVLSSLPTPYFHSQPNFRSFDSNDNVVAAGTKRSEPGGWPWRWILDGPPEGLALEKMLIG
ncbi:hypothetical protein CF319_g1700 [Tilletia indica]|nr:hypothetical protein CF319_g1700 [Tilletia indica]